MNGPNEIRNINQKFVADKVSALKTKALTAEQQNHPRAAVFRAEADALEKTLHESN